MDHAIILGHDKALRDVWRGFWEEKEPLVGINTAFLAIILGVAGF
jgi:hypothetical protein